MSITYKDAGVDKEAGYASVEKMKAYVQATHTPEVLSHLGGFSGLFLPDLSGYQQPVLVSGTDGVGTKLKLAIELDKHDTIGQDCVAMCVNDILCQGAKPLFFLDYIATGKLDPDTVAEIVKGVAAGCQLAKMALIGGETAEMPGFYANKDYDLAGFVVGVVDYPKIINKEKVKAGDVVLGLPSSGVHSNGFSLVRKLIEHHNLDLNQVYPPLTKPLGEVLLEPTKIYVPEISALLAKVDIHGLAHITGGGFVENIPRVLPQGLQAKLDLSEYQVPSLFIYLQELAQLDDQEMYSTFNMGIGMVIIIAAEDLETVLKIAQQENFSVVPLGVIEEGESEIIL